MTSAESLTVERPRTRPAVIISTACFLVGPGRYFAASLPLLFFHLHYLSTVYTLSFPFSFNTPTRWWGSSAFGNPKRAAGASSVCPDSHARAVADRAGAAGSTLGTATSARWAAEAFSLFLSEIFSYKFSYRFFSKKNYKF